MFFAGFERCGCLMAKSDDEPTRDVPRRIQTAVDKRWRYVGTECRWRKDDAERSSKSGDLLGCRNFSSFRFGFVFSLGRRVPDHRLQWGSKHKCLCFVFSRSKPTRPDLPVLQTLAFAPTLSLLSSHTGSSSSRPKPCCPRSGSSLPRPSGAHCRIAPPPPPRPSDGPRNHTVTSGSTSTPTSRDNGPPPREPTTTCKER